MSTTAGAPAVPETPPADGQWRPKIVALVCNWCTYTGADMAGTSRRTYAPYVRIIRLLCSGRIDPLLILQAFEQGADAVMVSGCHPGDCHYVQGNLHARRRLTVLRSLLDFVGLDQRRLHYAWVSASEAVKWSRLVDEVTAKVREAGPLGPWARPAIDAWQPPFELPEAGAAPRPRPAAAEPEAITGHLRELAAGLLDGGQVKLVIGHTAGSLPGQMVPAFARTSQEAGLLSWNERCAGNLAVYLPGKLKQAGGPVAVVVKSCDARAVAGLLRENQVRREDAVLLGVECAGIWHQERLAARCHSCAEAVSPLADWTLTATGAVQGSVPPRNDRAIGPDPRSAQLAVLRERPAAERREFWQQEFGRCIRCYACRAVCPLCYCAACIADKQRPQWIPTAIDGAGNMAWNLTRAMHLAGRCIDCDECARACPADIRLDLLNRAVAGEIAGRYGYQAGADPALAAPLTTFQTDDPDGFL